MDRVIKWLYTYRDLKEAVSQTATFKLPKVFKFTNLPKNNEFEMNYLIFKFIHLPK
jgi:hypothetical protein